jgi:hypothetical protein
MPNAKPAPTPTKTKSTTRAKSVAASGLSQAKPGRATTGDFTVTLGPQTVKTLSSRKANVKALMEVLGETIEESRKSGRSMGFMVEVDRTGQPRILPAKDLPAKVEPKPASRPADDEDDLNRALDAARERGRLRAAEVLSGDDMLSAEDFAELLGVSRVTVNAKRQKREVLALEGAKRGFRFPAWQIDENGKPFEVLPRLFELLGDSPWTVYRFLVQRHPELDGASAQDYLRRGRADQVVEAAESVARGAFA